MRFHPILFASVIFLLCGCLASEFTAPSVPQPTDNQTTQTAQEALPTIKDVQVEVPPAEVYPEEAVKGPVLSPSADDDPSIGPADAPVTIIVFSNYECYYCALAADVFKQVTSDYGGKVRLVYRDMPGSASAHKAAEATDCAREQGKFWQYHDKLFANRMMFTDTELKNYANDLGLDMIKFVDCLDSGKYSKEVEDDRKAGEKLGVTGTPTFFVNSDVVVGYYPYDKLKKIIDTKL